MAEVGYATTRTMPGDQRLSQILTLAAEMFFEKGYRGVSIRDLASAVGIKISSLYYYFPSKDEILYQIIKTHLDALLEVAHGAVQSCGADATCTERLRGLIRESIVQLIDDRLAAGISSSQWRELPRDRQRELGAMIDQYEQLYRELIREGIEGGEFVEIDVALATYIILGAQTRLSAWFRPGGRLTPAKVGDTYSYLLVRSLAVDPTAIKS